MEQIRNLEQINFQKSIEQLKEMGFSPIPDKVIFGIPGAKDMLEKGLQHFIGTNAKWLPEYNDVAKWLSDNEGRGLLCYGNCGRGKSVICCKIIPLLLHHYYRKIVSCYDAQQMNANIDMVKSEHIICIDDVGCENMSVKYGEKRLAFAEIVDEAEKKGKLLIVTTNLSLDELEQKYGERTMDRIVAIMKRVKFIGESQRK